MLLPFCVQTRTEAPALSVNEENEKVWPVVSFRNAHAFMSPGDPPEFFISTYSSLLSLFFVPLTIRTIRILGGVGVLVAVGGTGVLVGGTGVSVGGDGELATVGVAVGGVPPDGVEVGGLPPLGVAVGGASPVAVDVGEAPTA